MDVYGDKYLLKAERAKNFGQKQRRLCEKFSIICWDF
jgi:hypothetical protein